MRSWLLRWPAFSCLRSDPPESVPVRALYQRNISVLVLALLLGDLLSDTKTGAIVDSSSGKLCVLWVVAPRLLDSDDDFHTRGSS